MPNLRPVPDTLPHLEEQLALIRAGALVHVRPYGAITLGQEGLALADLAALAEHVVGFTDDGHGVQSADLTRQAMLAARALDRPISAHCEDTALAAGGVIHAGPYAAAHGLPGIPSASEWRPLERDLALVRETGCRYHALHVSTKESVALIRAAKAEGLPVTAETAPHYLTLTEADLRDEGRFKMNPPLRETADQNALLEALADGTIDVIATDHAPHTAAEKAGGLRESLMGIVGLETALPVLFTRLVLPGLLSLPRLLTALCDAPRALLRLPGGLRPGAPADLALLDLSTPYAIHPESFRSLGRATPFEGWPVRGRAALTMVGGEIVHQEA
jgi:dihydroorotase